MASLPHTISPLCANITVQLGDVANDIDDVKGALWMVTPYVPSPCRGPYGQLGLP